MKSLAHLSLNPMKGSVCLVTLLLCAAPVYATTWMVTNTNDSGSGSLRTIIAGAASGDIIEFASSMNGQTIHLTTGQLAIGKSITVDASGLGFSPVIDAGGHSRVVEITAGNVVLAGLILTNGYVNSDNSGAGIRLDSGATLYGNSLTVCGCVANNSSIGGGILVYQNASLTLLLSTISGCMGTNNSYGGGLNCYGTAFLEYCTLTGNISDIGGAAVEASIGTVTLDDCTLSGNSALSTYGGGIQLSGGTVILNNCTIVGNSAYQCGGIDNAGNYPLFMTNTIVAANAQTYYGDIQGPFAGANNFVGGNPQLSPLGNYGGLTQTMPPLSGSPVIDAGTDSVTSFLSNDQLLDPRRSGAHVDIGAVEVQFGAPASQPPVLNHLARSGNQFQFGFTNAPYTDFTALTSTNLALPLTNWTVLGNVTEISRGQYQFIDTSAANGAQFYRVVSP